MMPYEKGYYSTLMRFGLDKVAGYFQNVVGFSDLDKYNKSRDVARAAYKAQQDFRDAQERGEEAVKPDESAWITASRKFNPETIGGTNLGRLGKYQEVPETIGFTGKGRMSGSSTGEGYMSREDLLGRLRGAFMADKENPELWKAISESEHPYFTSTEAY